MTLDRAVISPDHMKQTLLPYTTSTILNDSHTLLRPDHCRAPVAVRICEPQCITYLSGCLRVQFRMYVDGACTWLPYFDMALYILFVRLLRLSMFKRLKIYYYERTLPLFFTCNFQFPLSVPHLYVHCPLQFDPQIHSASPSTHALCTDR